MDISVPRFNPVDAGVVPHVVVPDPAALEIRPATVLDVHGMSALINDYASSRVMLARGPQYLYEHIKDYLVVTAPAVGTGEEVVVGCGASLGLWEDFAEIRSLAVHPALHRKGLGRRIVNALVDACFKLHIHRIFCFTLAPDFFASCGFSQVAREDLPKVVWAECSRCPKYYRCDEIGMMKVV